MNTNLLKAKLAEKGYTLKAFRTEIGVSSTTLTMYCQNKRKPSFEFLARARDVLGLSHEEFMRIFFD